MNASFCLALSLLLPTIHLSANPQDDSAPQELAQASTEKTAFMEVNDKDGDGKLTKEEFPELARRLFDRVDRNGDGFVDAEEDAAFRKSRQSDGDRNPAQGVATKFDVEYARIGNRGLLLDLYIPENAEARLPCIVWIHGGAGAAAARATVRPGGSRQKATSSQV